MIHELAATGLDARAIGRRLDIGAPAVRKILAGEPQGQRGRPALIVPTPAEARILKAAHVKSNRARGKGSMTLAARMVAQTDADISPALAAAILKPRASKHTLTSVIKRHMRVSTHVINFHRSPREVSLSLGDVPGQLRMGPDGSRLRAGDRQSWDDGSINFIVCVPWPWGGDKCSDRYGVRIGRYQLLGCLDDATHYSPAFTFTMRPAESYRAADIVAACGRTWRDNHAPETVMFERGIWEAHQVTRFLHHTGLQIQRAYSPRTKLIENWWNYLWDILALISEGQIGRFRGEMQDNNKLLTACRKGQEDPRKHFPMLGQALDHIEQAIEYRNHDPLESKTYGTWIPAERYAADLAENPRPALDPGLAWAWAPVQEVWTVRGGHIGGTIKSAVGFSFPYKFADPALLELEGVKLRVFFDPHDASQRAGIVLAQNHLGRKVGTVITDRAVLISDVPTATEQAAGLAAGRTFGGLQRAITARKEQHALVRSEYRSLGLRPAQRKTASEIRDGLGSIARMETGPAALQPDAPDPSHPSDPRISLPPREQIDLSRRSLTSPPAEPDLSTRIPILTADGSRRGRTSADIEAPPRRNSRAALLTT